MVRFALSGNQTGAVATARTAGVRRAADPVPAARPTGLSTTRTPGATPPAGSGGSGAPAVAGGSGRSGRPAGAARRAGFRRLPPAARPGRAAGARGPSGSGSEARSGRSAGSVRAVGALASAVVLLLGVLSWPAPQARAASAYGRVALAVAASKRGAPYAYGAAGPDRFDCSGLTLYSFRRAGKRLPRTAELQYERTRHISRSRRTPGDLVFFPQGALSGPIGHVGIYAGRGRIWHAPRPGGRVRLERIWTRNVRYGRAV